MMNKVIFVFIILILESFPVLASQNVVLYHADFHGHLAQKIYVQLKKVHPANKLRVSLTSDKGLRKIICERSNDLKPEEVFVLQQRMLPAAKYTLTVEILNQAGKILHQVVETFDKQYDGIPKVGIDEYNNICVQGKPFFMVAPFFVGKEKAIKKWEDYINTLKGVGFMDRRYTIEGWKEFLDLGGKYGKMVVGPLRGYYWPHRTATGRYQTADGKYHKDRTINIEKLIEYVNLTKEHESLLMWAWKDEPHLGGRKAISPGEVRRWTEKCHELDPHHLVFCNFGGYGFTHIGPKYPEDNWHQKHIKKYCYMFYNPDVSKKMAGAEVNVEKRQLVADVYSQDYYPIEYEKSAAKKGYVVSIEDMCLAMDRMREWNYNLAPVMAYVETCDIKGRGTPAPSPEEVKLLIWANIIHGAKGISWFHYFNPTPSDNLKEMARFLDQITRLTPAVLGIDYVGKVSVEGNKSGRVDVMIKEYDQKIYLFAANLKRKENTVRFNIEGMVPNSQVEVFDESRKISAEVNSFTDNFPKLGVRIYKIKKQSGQ